MVQWKRRNLTEACTEKTVLRKGREGVTRKDMIHIIILSGGSGRRLWPLSSDIYSKQFIRMFPREDGRYESLIVRTYRGVRKLGEEMDVTICAGKDQVPAICSQLSENINLCTEPCQRDTFPAVALAAARIRARGGRDDDVAVICPVDAYVEDDFFRALLEMGEHVRGASNRLTLLGIVPGGSGGPGGPGEPGEGYDYILPANGEKLCAVTAIHRKPDAAQAAALMRQGALWNSGAFACRVGYILERSKETLGVADYREMMSRYALLPHVSFDEAVTEREKRRKVMRFSGVWKDIGTWNGLTQAMSAPTIGRVRMEDACENVYAVNELNLPVLCVGIKDAVICAAPEGILIADRARASSLKPHVDALMSEPRRDGDLCQLLVADRNSLTCRIILKSGERVRYHNHVRRDECWVVTDGTGVAFIDGARRPVGPGSLVRLARGVKHGLLAREDMAVIEVQTGDYFGADDRHVFPEIESSFL